MAARSSATLVRGWAGGGARLIVGAAAVAGVGLGGRCRLRETRISIRRVRHVGCRGAGLGTVCVGGRREPDSTDSGQRSQGCCNRQISQ